MEKLVLTTAITVLLSSLPVFGDVNLKPRVFEYHYGEDVAMWQGKDFNPDDRENVIPMIIEGEYSSTCKFHAYGIVEYYYMGKLTENICGYVHTSQAIINKLKEEYCDIALERGGDIDLKLAHEQGCALGGH